MNTMLDVHHSLAIEPPHRRRSAMAAFFYQSMFDHVTICPVCAKEGAERVDTYMRNYDMQLAAQAKKQQEAERR